MTTSTRKSFSGFLTAATIVATIAGCTGSIDTPGVDDRPGQGGSGAGGSGTGGIDKPPPTPGNGPEPTIDLAYVGMRRLTREEYNNTVRDLLGTVQRPADRFPADPRAYSFDNNQKSLVTSSGLLQMHGEAARDLVDEAMASNPAAGGQFRSCDVVATGRPCAQQILEAFAPRAWRRPLRTGELARLMALYDAGVADGDDGNPSGLKAALRAVLGAPQFFYRMEIDPDPNTTTAHPVTDHEMASRLSYLLWASMPDQTLFDAATAQGLRTVDGIESEIARMLADERSAGFVRAFADNWFEAVRLPSHQVDTGTYSTWNDTLRDSMQSETEMFFRHVLDGSGTIADLLTSRTVLVNRPLALHYGLPAVGLTDALTPVELTGAAAQQRGGVMRQGTFLTALSLPTRSSIINRAVWVYENLLCQDRPVPPVDVPALPTDGANVPETQRERILLHESTPACGGCHRVFDGLGLPFENYDGVGAWRTMDNNVPVDASADWEGNHFNNADELILFLVEDPRYSECTVRKMLSYALGRKPADTDQPWLTWATTELGLRGGKLHDLVTLVATSEPFRTRRGGQ